jgi:hypothetical protein
VQWRFCNNLTGRPEVECQRLGAPIRQQAAAGIQILNGWKEIANYLGKAVRTVQRYEVELRLPVHRPAGKSAAAVVATKAELKVPDRAVVPVQDSISRVPGHRHHGQPVRLVGTIRAVGTQLRNGSGLHRASRGGPYYIRLVFAISFVCSGILKISFHQGPMKIPGGTTVYIGPPAKPIPKQMSDAIGTALGRIAESGERPSAQGIHRSRGASPRRRS